MSDVTLDTVTQEVTINTTNETVILDTGGVGPRGAQGETGPQGPQGDPGATGATGDGGSIVASLAALKALDTTEVTIAKLNASNRHLNWAWISGDFTAHHAADTLGGYYVKADAVASSAGSWVAQREGFTFNPHMMGIAPVYSTGDLAAATDMSTAYQNALDLCAVVFPSRSRGIGGEVCDNAGYVRLNTGLVLPGPIKLNLISNINFYGTGSAISDPGDDGAGGPLLSGDKHQYYDISIASLRDANGNSTVPSSRNASGTVGLHIKRMQFSRVYVGECHGFTKHNIFLDSTNTDFTGQHIQMNNILLGDLSYGGSGLYCESDSALDGAVQGNIITFLNPFSNFQDVVLGPATDNNTASNTIYMAANDNAATGQAELAVGGTKNKVYMGFIEGNIEMYASSDGNQVQYSAASIATVSVSDSGTNNYFECNGVSLAFAADKSAKMIAGTAAGTSSTGNLDLFRLGSGADNRFLHGIRSYAYDSTSIPAEMAAIYMYQISHTNGNLNSALDVYTRVGDAYAIRARFWAGLDVGNSGDPGAGKINAANGYNVGGVAGATGSYSSVTVAGGLVTSGVVGAQRLLKSADESVTSSTTLQNDDTLTFAMLANTKYVIELNVMVMTASATPSFKFGFTHPAAANTIECSYRVNNAANQSLGSVSGSLPSGAFGMNGTQPCFLKFFITFNNGANAGNFTFQWAQNTSDANAVTVRAGSYLEYEAA